MSVNFIHALAGAAAGITSMTLTYPLVTISSRLQVLKNSRGKLSSLSLLKALKSLWIEEGLEGLFAGLNSGLLGIAITNGTYYYFYEKSKSIVLKQRNISPSPTKTIAAGAIAGAITAIVTNPIWVINTRLVTKNTGNVENLPESARKGTIVLLFKIIREEGVLALWQGIMPALILVINPIIQYTVFEQIKLLLRKRRKLSSLDYFLVGAFSKLVATFITYPYILVKSRMQLKKPKDEKHLSGSAIAEFKRILRDGGAAGLYKGIHAKLLQSILTSAFLFMTKEKFYEWLLKFILFIRLLQS